LPLVAKPRQLGQGVFVFVTLDPKAREAGLDVFGKTLGERHGSNPFGRRGDGIE
jgi:hypothetical protein